MNNLRERDYQFYEYTVKDLSWDEGHSTLTLKCKYRERGLTRILLKGVRKQEFICFMQSHTIDYVIPTYVLEMNAVCYEIHFMDLAETTRIWAESMEFE